MQKLLVLSFVLCLFSFSKASAQNDEENWNNYIKYFGQTLADSLENSDTTFFNSVFNKDLFIDKFIIRKDDKIIQEFNQDYVPILKRKLDIATGIVEITHNSYYEFLNSYTSVDDEIHLILRLVEKEGGLNYHDFQVEWIDSSLQVVDIYYYSTGQKISETLGDLYRILLRGTLDEKFHGAKTNESEQAILSLGKCKNLIEAMQYKSAMAEYIKIPEKYQQKRIYKLWRIRIAANLEDDQYLEAINDFNESYPDDPSFYLYAYEKALFKEQYNDALKYINKLDISVGLDPFLDYYRSLIHVLTEDYDLAQEKLENLLQKYYYENGTDLLLQVYLKTEQKTKAIKLLNSYINGLGYTKENLAKWVEETHPEFSKSIDFLHWKKTDHE